eukprot:m.204562 g.204562  ORF g.204562 m.204562 type:complete len:543 (-) comp18472_c1_seq5:132-1760(-)
MAALCPGLWLRACLLPGLVCMLSLTGSDAASDTGSTTRPIKALMFVLVDDLGFNDLLGTDNISAPFVRELAQESVRLDNYYVEPVCSPARSALMAGRYPPRFGLQHQVIWSGQPAGVPLNETFFPELLSQAGWATHAIGKYHLGFYSWPHTATFRGFDSFYGFFGGGQDYLTHVEADGSESPGPQLGNGYDFWQTDGRNCGPGCAVPLRNASGVYSTSAFSQRAVDLVQAHDGVKPLFVYLAFQAVHGPIEAPQEYVDRNQHIPKGRRRTFAGMISCLDEGLRNISLALKDKGWWDDTAIIISTDNGGDTSQAVGGKCPPLSYCGGTGNNWPLRGGKHTVWEGGVRGFAMLRHPLLSGAGGWRYPGLFHLVDWFRTVLSMAGVTSTEPATAKLDGVDQWPALLARNGSVYSRRQEVLLQLDPWGIAYHGQQGDGPKAALRQGPWKIIVGPPGCPDAVFRPEAPPPAKHKPSCSRLPASSVLLFHVESDPAETTNVAAQHPDIVAQLKARLLHYNLTSVQPFYPDNDPKADPKLHDGLWEPWQ